MAKIKVLMVLGNTGRGGAQTFAVNVLRLIDRDKFQVDFVVNEIYENGYADEIKGYGSKIYTIPYFRIYNWPVYSAAWKKLLTSEHYDIVHGHVSSSASIYLDIARKYGCATIAHSHSAGYRGNKALQGIKKIFTVGAKSKADYWFGCSDLAAQRMFGNDYVKYKNYYDMPNAVVVKNYLYNEEKRKSVRAFLDVSDDTPLYGHVGSFTAAKNHEFLFDVFAEILKIEPHAKFVLAGDGELRSKIEESIRSRGLSEKVQLAGNVGNVNEYFMAMDAMIFPSFFEGFPVTALEAQATGLKTLISDTITKEIFLTDCAISMSLKQSPAVWARKAVGSKSTDRKRYNLPISESKYNMENSVTLIMRLYQEMYDGMKQDG